MQRSGLVTGLAFAGFVTLTFSCDDAAPPTPLLCFTASLTAGAYGIDRLADSSASRASRLALGVLVALALTFAASCAASLSRPLLLLVLTAIVTSVVAYTFPVLPGRRRVKDVPFLKAFYVGVAWLSLLMACRPPSAPNSIVVLFLVYARVVMGAIASDVKDIDDDRARKIRTFAVQYGRTVTLRSLSLGHAALAAAYAISVLTHVVPLRVLLGGVDAALAAATLHLISRWRPQTTGLGTDLLLEMTACVPLVGLVF